MECEKSVESETSGNQMADEYEVLIPGLPNDLALFCLARVPRSSHGSMSGVSQSWRNVIHGTELWEIRRKMSFTEELLYLWIEYERQLSYLDPPPHLNVKMYPGYRAYRTELRCFDPSLEKWSKLPTMPQRNGITEYSGGHSAVVSFDGKLFVIGGHLLGFHHNDKPHEPCGDVSYFDAKSYCWKKAGGLNVARADCMAGVIDNQLYVFGGEVKDFCRTETAEVYDPVTDSWKFVRGMTYPIELASSVVMKNKFYGVSGPVPGGPNSDGYRLLWQGVVYDAHTNEWEDMASELRTGWFNSATVLNGRIYTAGKLRKDEISNFDYDDFDRLEFYRTIWSYTPSQEFWEEFHELRGGSREDFAKRGTAIVSYCGKLCLISVDPYEGENDIMATISMVMVEVKESIEGPTGQEIFEMETEIPFSYYDIEREQPIIKWCQVIVL